MLAPDFMATLPDHRICDRGEFLDLIAKPRPFAEPAGDEAYAAHQIRAGLEAHAAAGPGCSETAR